MPRTASNSASPDDYVCRPSPQPLLIQPNRMGSSIVRTTRSQRIFSSWGPDIPSDPSFDFLPALYSALFFEDEQSESEFLQDQSDQVPTPQICITTTAALHTNMHTSASAITESDNPAPLPLSRKQKFKVEGHQRRKKRKQGQLHIDGKLLDRFPQNAPRIDVDMSFEKAKVTSTAFIAINDVEKTQRTYSLNELVGETSEFKFKLQKWNGRDPRLIVDKDGIICAILAGHPDAEDWPDVHRHAADALEQARLRCFPEYSVHRRGDFATLVCGISHGGGQRFPMNLRNKNASQAEALSQLNRMECFIRMANFASAIMARRAPELHLHYASTLQKLQQKDSTLRRPFPCSVFAAAAYNLGPQTICFTHKDPGNFAGGMCSVTPCGKFDPTKGGHLVLWECRVVVEFPPGSTILLPSSVIAHSNCSISSSETRYSFTQYSAGGLFRWVNNQFQRSQDFRASLSPQELKEEEQRDRNRWKEVLMLLPRVNAVDNSLANNGSSKFLY